MAKAGVSPGIPVVTYKNGHKIKLGHAVIEGKDPKITIYLSSRAAFDYAVSVLEEIVLNEKS